MIVLIFIAALVWGSVVALPVSSLAMVAHMWLYRKGRAAAWIVFQKTFYWTFGVVAILVFLVGLGSKLAS